MALDAVRDYWHEALFRDHRHELLGRSVKRMRCHQHNARRLMILIDLVVPGCDLRNPLQSVLNKRLSACAIFDAKHGRNSATDEVFSGSISWRLDTSAA